MSFHQFWANVDVAPVADMAFREFSIIYEEHRYDVPGDFTRVWTLGLNLEKGSSLDEMVSV